MPQTAIKSADDVRALLDARDSTHVTIGLFDMQGQLRGDFVSVDRFKAGLGGFYAFDAALGCAADFTDVPYEIKGIFGGDDGNSGDAVARIIPDSCRTLNWMPQNCNLLFLLEYDERSSASAYCSRSICRRAVERCLALGFNSIHAHEFEFSLLKETAESLREKGFRNLRSARPASSFRILHEQAAYQAFFDDLTDTMRAMGIPIDALHWEIGPAHAEAALRHGPSVWAADNAALFKTYARLVARRHGFLMTFMARWSNEFHGQSGHVHLSLYDEHGNSAFFDPKADDGIGDRMRFFIGGVEKLMPELALIWMPNVNSYKRLEPGIFTAPVASWGIETKNTAIRAIKGSATSQRIELRVPGADANPYLVLAALLNSGLWGIENELDPCAPYQGGDIWKHIRQFANDRFLPKTLSDSIRLFRQSERAVEFFGEEFVRIFSEFREHQDDDFRVRVTDQELARFLEFA